MQNIKLNIDIQAGIPLSVTELNNIIRSSGGECFLYGECLLDLFLDRSEIRSYDILTSLPIPKLIRVLGLGNGEGCGLKKSLTLYSSYDEGDNLFYVLDEDFIDDIRDGNFYYINILFSEGSLLDKLSSFLLPVERMAFDFSDFYFADFIEGLFVSRELSLSEKETKGLSYSLLSLFRLARYIVKYDLDNTELIEFKGKLDIDRRLYPRRSWRLEILRLMSLSKPSKCFELMRKWGFLQYFFPELLEGYGVSQNEYHKYDVYYHSLMACDSADKALPLIRFSALFHDIGKPRSKKKKYLDNNEDKDVFYDHENIGSRMSYAILRRFGFSYGAASRISNLVRLHMFHYTPSWTDKAVRRFVRKANSELSNLIELRKADRLGSGTKTANSKAIGKLLYRIGKLDKEDKEFKIKDLDISGNDLMEAFSLKEGVIIGNLLNHLKSLVLDKGISNERDALLSCAREYLSSR